MMAFVVIVNKGDIRKVSETTTHVLTWFEEWYAFFEIIYGKRINRWVDGIEKYKVSDATLRKLFLTRLKQVLSTRQEWPRFATYREDEIFRCPRKWFNYEGTRVIHV